MRDRLIELMRNADNDKNLGWYDLYDLCRGKGCAEYFADYLIANGVTVQEWISVKDRLPDDLVNVLTCDAKGNIHIMWHHKDFMHPFNVGRNDLRYYPVTHWMPMPQPPKGEGV